MTSKIETWHVSKNGLTRIQSTLAEEGRTESKDLESWVESTPEIIDHDLIIIGRQVITRSGPIDLLAIDKSGNTVIVELKRDMVPRIALTQAIDYASDVAGWTVDRLSETCAKYSEKSLEDALAESFPDVDIESMNINETQRILLVGFSLEPALERMIAWLSESLGMSINAIVLKYIKTALGDEILCRTTMLSEAVELAKASKRKIRIETSDEPGNYSDEELRKLLTIYFAKDIYSARRMRDVLIPYCLDHETVWRDDLKREFVRLGQSDSESQAGYFLSLISAQLGNARYDYLRQVIKYEYPNFPWEKDKYRIRDEYRDFMKELLDSLAESPATDERTNA